MTVITGSVSVIQAASDQLDRFFESQPNAVLVGSRGRAAMYDQYGYAAPPVSLCDPNQPRIGLRDFDVLFYTSLRSCDVEDDTLDAAYRPHPIGLNLGSYLDRDPEG